MIDNEGIPKYEESEDMNHIDPSKRIDIEYKNELLLVDELKLINTSIKHNRSDMLKFENDKFEDIVSRNMPTTFSDIVLEQLSLDYIFQRLKKILSLNTKIKPIDYSMCSEICKSLYLIIINCDVLAEEAVKRGVIEMLSTVATFPTFEGKYIIYKILSKILNAIPGTAQSCIEASIASAAIADCSKLDDSQIDFKSIFQFFAELTWQAILSDSLVEELIPFIGNCTTKNDEDLLYFVFETVANIIDHTNNIAMVCNELHNLLIPLFTIHHFTNPQSSKIQISALSLLEKMLEKSIIQKPEKIFMIVDKCMCDLLNSPGTDALEAESQFISIFFGDLDENSISIAEKISQTSESTKSSSDAQNIIDLITNFTPIAYDIFMNRNYEVKINIAEAYVNFLNFNYSCNIKNIVDIALHPQFIELCIEMLAIQKVSLTVSLVTTLTNVVSTLIYRGKINVLISNELFSDLYDEISELLEASEEVAAISNIFCSVLAPFKTE